MVHATMAALKIVTLASLISGVSSASWDYSNGPDGPANWNKAYPVCGTGAVLERQSPIDIPTTKEVLGASPLVPIETSYSPFTETFFNNGHTVQLNAGPGQGMSAGAAAYRVRNLEGTTAVSYSLLQVHFHWGKDQYAGSEHLIDGQAYPLEMHLVHTNDAIPIAQATSNQAGLGVIGVMFQVGAHNPALEPLTEQLPAIRSKGQSASATLDLNALLVGMDWSDYFSYAGSLTTPGCNEAVTWFVMRHTLVLSPAQLAAFHAVLGSEAGDPEKPVGHNYRPVQPVNGRVIYTRRGAINPPPGFTAGALAAMDGAAWAYSGPTGPASWHLTHPFCGTGQAFEAQSPIDIPSTMEEKGDSPVQPISLSYSADVYTLSNNGHTLKLSGGAAQSSMFAGAVPYAVRGRAEGDRVDWSLLQAHFHWGRTNTQGSEHTVNGMAYPLELHLVHTNDRIASSPLVAAAPYGLAVIGVFFEIGLPNVGLQAVVDSISTVMYKGQQNSVQVDWNRVLRGLDLGDYFTYAGSLTTPGCDEAATWIVMKHPLTVSQTQLDALRSVYHTEVGDPSPRVMGANFRPVQPLNGRVVYTATGAINPPKVFDEADGAAAMWTYDGMDPAGPSGWRVNYPLCGSGEPYEAQSPIDIPAAEEVVGASPLAELELKYRIGGERSRMFNNGHTLQIERSPQQNTMSAPGAAYAVRGRPQGEPLAYSLAQLHFHWGTDNFAGSEHTVDGVAHPLEMHLVHVNTDILSSPSYASAPYGLAVIGVMFEIGGENSALAPVISRLSSIQHKGEETNVELDLNKLLSGVDLTDYYSYAGSLTTPPCYESVTWLVLKSTLSISPKQLEAMRGLLHTAPGETPHPIGANYRPVQPVNGRVIYTKFGAINGPEGFKTVSASEWSYRGLDNPESWYKNHPLCGRGATYEAQSPIDIPAAEADEKGSPLVKVVTSYTPSSSTSIVNNGHTAKINFDSSKNTMTAGPLAYLVRNKQTLQGVSFIQYELAQMHFHWGPTGDATTGSEHTVDGRAFPLELHLVHVNSDLKATSTYASAPMGLAVIGVLFEVGEANEGLQAVVDSVPMAMNNGNEATLITVDLEAVLGPRFDYSDYYAYAGSLTTPPCYESVTWIVMRQTLTVSQEQLDALKAMKHTAAGVAVPHEIGANYRPVQPLNGRTVYTKTGAVNRVTAPQDSENEKEEDSEYSGLLITIIILAIITIAFVWFAVYKIHSRASVENNILSKLTAMTGGDAHGGEYNELRDIPSEANEDSL